MFFYNFVSLTGHREDERRRHLRTGREVLVGTRRTDRRASLSVPFVFFPKMVFGENVFFGKVVFATNVFFFAKKVFELWR